MGEGFGDAHSGKHLNAYLHERKSLKVHIGKRLKGCI